MKKIYSKILATAALTACIGGINAQITTFPYTEDFEGESQGGTSCGNAYTMAATGWTNETNDDIDWTADVGGTTSSNTGPSVDNTTGTSSGFYLYTETSSCYNQTAHLTTPVLDFTTLNYPNVDFAYHLYGAAMGTLHVDISTDGGGTWTLDVIPSLNDNQNVWQMQTINLTPYAGQSNVKLRFRGVTGTSFTSDMAIDDFSAYEGPSCPAPDGLTVTYNDNDSVIFTWNAGYNETMWNIELGTVGFTPGTGAEITAQSSTNMLDTISGLTQLTDYEIYIQADCGGGDESSWVGPLSFTTLPNCPDITGLTLDGVSADTVFLSWTGSGTESMWNIEYGPAGYTAGTGTVVASTNTTDTITGLAAGTAYDFYVQSDCGGADQGIWIGPISASTGCFTITPYTLPFTEDFETLTTATYFGNTAVYCGTDYAWDFATGNATNGRLRVGADAVTALSGTGSATMDVDPSAGTTTQEMILTIDLSGYSASNNLFLSFDYMHHGDESNTNDRVWVRGSDTDAWLVVYDWIGNATSGSGFTYNVEEINISAFLTAGGQTPSSTFQVKFGQEDNFPATSTTASDGLTIDNVVIEEITCPKPTNIFASYINADTVVLSWTAGLGETAWNVEYGTIGFTQGSGTSAMFDSNPDTITGLSLGGIYDFYLQADCGGGDASTWQGPITVAMPIVNDTACGAILVDVDGQTRFFSNVGATVDPGESALGNSPNNTVWFQAIVPASGHMAIGTCDTPIDTELEVFADTADCSDFSTFGSLGYADWNPWGCTGSHPAGIELCGLTPGDTVIFWVGSWSNGNTGIFPLTLWDLEVEAGSGTDITLCETDSLDLWTQLSGQDHNMGNWDYPNNPNGITDDSVFVAANATIGGDEVYYIIANSCMEDTATVTVDVVGPANSGTAVNPFDACNTNVFLFDGLTGTVDMGGTWSDDTGTGLLQGDVFVAHAVPVGGYNFTYTATNGVCPDQSTTITVNIMDCTDIPESDINFSVYPNPNNGEFFVENNGNTGLVTIEVIDIQGKVVYNNRLNISNGDRESISIENAESGMYMIRIISNDNVVNHPMIVK